MGSMTPFTGGVNRSKHASSSFLSIQFQFKFSSMHAFRPTWRREIRSCRYVRRDPHTLFCSPISLGHQGSAGPFDGPILLRPSLPPLCHHAERLCHWAVLRGVALGRHVFHLDFHDTDKSHSGRLLSPKRDDACCFGRVDCKSSEVQKLSSISCTHAHTYHIWIHTSFCVSCPHCYLLADSTVCVFAPIGADTKATWGSRQRLDRGTGRDKPRLLCG